MLTCNGIIPMLLWSKKVRVNIPALFTITIFINIGMWFERFVIIVTSLAHEYRAVAVAQLPAELGRDGDLSRAASRGSSCGSCCSCGCCRRCRSPS
jgi:hypothetical protein